MPASGHPSKPSALPVVADLYVHERRARQQGYQRIAGVDEVGRGPLAGPVVAAAVILPAAGVDLPVADSKTLSSARRRVLAEALLRHPGVCVGVAAVGAARIDEINILQATLEAMAQALGALAGAADFALVDGLASRSFPLPAEFIVRGDALSASIAAASIIAKVYRDALMARLETTYPGYGFARHKGYGTQEHRAALGRLGPTALHRQSFAPVAASTNPRLRQPDLPLSTG